MGQRIYYNTTMDENLMKEFKVLAIQFGSSQDEPHSVIHQIRRVKVHGHKALNPQGS